MKEKLTKVKKEKKGQGKAKAESLALVTGEELLKMENLIKKELFEIRFKVKTASWGNVSKIKNNKKQIARIQTELNRRVLEQSKK